MEVRKCKGECSHRNLSLYALNTCMMICQYYTFCVSADKPDVPVTNHCESVIAWTVIVSIKVKELLLEPLLIKICIYFYSLLCMYFKNMPI